MITAVVITGLCLTAAAWATIWLWRFTVAAVDAYRLARTQRIRERL